MPGPLTAAGAQGEPSRYAPLSMDRYLTGLWTQRSPLRDADVPYLYGKFYSASRFDSLWDGLNCELSSKLTLIRRPGSSVYNSQVFPAINRYYPFKYLTAGTEFIKVMADTAGVVYDATGPGTKTPLFAKSAGAGKTFFQGVGNTLYFSDGVDAKKLLQPTLAWQANFQNQTGDWILDTYGNIQVNAGLQSAQIMQACVAEIQTVYYLFVQVASPGLNLLSGGIFGMPCTLAFDANSPFAGYSGTYNATGIYAAQASNWIMLELGQAASAIALQPVEGTVGIGGETGGSYPSFNYLDGPYGSQGLATIDGGAVWINYGSNLQNWGGAGPAAAPSLGVSVSGGYPVEAAQWTAGAVYGAPLLLVDSNSNIQRLLSPWASSMATTGASAPTWNATVNGTTTDGTAEWINKGSGTWTASASYALGDIVKFLNGYAVCVQAGTSAGAPQPLGSSGYGSQFTDNTVVWEMLSTPWAAWAATTEVASTLGIADSNGNLQAPIVSGAAGGSAPTWSIVPGSYTTDGAMTWEMTGIVNPAETAQKYYAYAWGNSVSGAVSTASPMAGPIQAIEGQIPVVSGQLPADPQFDTVIVYATAQGGSTLLQLAQFPVCNLSPFVSGNGPWAGGRGGSQSGEGVWTFYDTLGDAGLNEDIEAAIADANDPPPANITAMAYYLGRIWGVVNNQVVWSTGPDVTTGNGLEAFAPLNSDACQELCVRLLPITASSGSALLVYSNANVYVIQGNGTSGNPFTPMTVYMPNIGLLNYDALDVVGSTSYLLTNASKFVSLDPSAGYTEAGFPVGDQFIEVTTGGISSALYNPATAFVTWYEKSSPDSGIYIADGAVGWFRLSPVSAPESGMLWSPRAAIAGGTSAVQAVETSPGLKTLLIGPPATATGSAVSPASVSLSSPATGGASASYAGTEPVAMMGACSPGDAFRCTLAAPSSECTLVFYNSFRQILESNGLLPEAPPGKLYEAPANTAFFVVTVPTPTAAGANSVELGYNDNQTLTLEATISAGVVTTAITASAPGSGAAINVWPLGVAFAGTVFDFTALSSGAGLELVFFDAFLNVLATENVTLGNFTAPAGTASWAVQPGTLAGGANTASFTVSEIGGPILMRDLSTNADNGTNYANTYATVGNIQLCQPSEIAEVAYASLYSIKTGTAPTCGFLFDEIGISAAVPSFDMLIATSNEPPELPKSSTLYQQRFVLLQNGECPKCQHVQFRVQWSAENYASELLGHTIFGAKHQERSAQ